MARGKRRWSVRLAQEQSGQIGISHDSFENVALAMGKRFLHYNHTQDIDALYRKIDALTAADLHAVAQDLFREDRLTTLIYG